MKKKALYLMIACLSLFVYPQLAKAGTSTIASEKTELQIDPVAAKSLLNKMNETKIPHHFLHKKNEAGNESASKEVVGGVIYVSGAALVLIIILLIVLL